MPIGPDTRTDIFFLERDVRDTVQKNTEVVHSAVIPVNPAMGYDPEVAFFVFKEIADDVVADGAFDKRIGFVVDKLLQQKEIVEKPLRKPFDNVSFVSGVTILGNGNVCLALSIPGILNTLVNNQVNKTINT